jgi:hypothetical protein
LAILLKLSPFLTVYFFPPLPVDELPPETSEKSADVVSGVAGLPVAGAFLVLEAPPTSEKSAFGLWSALVILSLARIDAATSRAAHHSAETVPYEMISEISTPEL